NNWFSTHTGMNGLRDALGIMEEDVPPTLVLYPLKAPNRRVERRPELVNGLLRRMYPRVINMSHHEERDRFLESTGSLCMHDAHRTVYAAISRRTDPDLAAAWAEKMGYRLVAFHATDANGKPYYHTNVMMYIGHDLAVICHESIERPDERARVEAALKESGLTVISITRDQVEHFCGNALTLTNNRNERLLVMSSRAWANYTAPHQKIIEDHCRVLHADLSAFEDVGGGSARCLIGELF
ncbi:MAG: amidinotransferase, partial [Candidatus Sumerlaeia bacterium]|nr:amidinotransferase [Candidatus Sumerlaeia bacterium]